MSEEATRSKGVVTKFNDQKGYGFIKPDEGGEELFVHQTAIKSDGYRSLRLGQVVEFSTVIEGEKMKAIDVTAPGGGPVDATSQRGNNGRNGNSRGGYGFSGGRNDGNGYGRRSGGAECFNCGETGHRARDCNRRIGDGGNDGCFTCGGIGHFSRECPTGRRAARNDGECFNCGVPGHMARDCTLGASGNNRRGGGVSRFSGSGGGNKCYNCGESGHFARECEAPRE